MRFISFLISLFVFSFLFSQVTAEVNLRNFSCAPTLSSSGNEGISPMEGDPSFTIAGKVCAVSGELSLSELDAQVMALAPLSLDRSYGSGAIDNVFHRQGWVEGHYGGLMIKKHKLNQMEFHGACFCGPYKQKLFFYSGLHSRADYDFVVNEEMFARGMTNLMGPEISGRSHAKNCSLEKRDPYLSKSDRYLLTTGSGLKMEFEREGTEGWMIYRMIEQVLPNSHRYVYSYDTKGNLAGVKALGEQGQELAWAKFVETKNEVAVTLSNGAKVLYKYDKAGRLVSVDSSEAPLVKYEYDKYHHLTKEIHPDKREVKYEYYSMHPEAPGFTNNKADLLPGRVKRILVPALKEGSFCTTHEFKYTFNYFSDDKQVTQVKDYFGGVVRYHVLNGRVEAIERRESEKGATYSWERYYWGKADGNLLSRVVATGEGEILSVKTYEYDERGNPVKECLYGNLTGRSNEKIVCDSKGVPLNPHLEHHEIRRGFSVNKNLLLWEERGAVREEYSYLGSTDLIERKLTLAEGEIKERRFYLYDDNKALVREVLDDGCHEEYGDLTGVTERKMSLRFYTDSKTGLPTAQGERYLDLESGEERLINRCETEYGQKGRPLCQRIYDADKNFVFEKKWQYDPHGNILREFDSNGIEVRRTFDANGNQLTEEGPLFDHKRVFTYDVMNRKIRVEEIHPQETLSTHFTYDPLGRKVAEVDPYGNEKKFTYDFLGREVKVEMPLVENTSGQLLRPTIEKGYNELNQVVRLRDAGGRETLITPNFKGSPLLVVHPDGTEERWEYDLEGEEVLYVAPNGTRRVTRRDWKGRPLEIKEFSAGGELLRCSSKTYNTFHLLSETDEGGCTTYYEYDGAGRLIKTTKGGVITELTYDARGQVVKKVTAGELVERFAYDKLGRVIEESRETGAGEQLLFKKTGYDLLGKKIVEVEAGGTTTYRYNSKGELIEQVDPLGRVSTHLYNHRFVNAKGQKVLQVTSCSPDGIVKVATSDAAGRIRSTVVKEREGRTLQQTEKFYSLSGNLIKTVQSVIYNGEVEREFVVKCAYDLRDRLTELVEGDGTPETKTTRYRYNRFGQKEGLIKPDGVEISYTYDPLGRLSSEVSSDGTVNYGFYYDPMSRLIKVEDLVLGTISTRTYDLLGRKIEERLATGASVSWEYDSLGRSVRITHEGLEPIEYSYDACFLRRVSWRGEEVDYLRYNLGGKLLEGTYVSYTFDEMGRATGWRGWGQEEGALYDLGDNLVEKQLNGEITSYRYDGLKQLEEERGSRSQSYRYDSLYNRRLKNGEACEINGLNQMLSLGGTRYTYDRNGNRTSEERGGVKTLFRYDARDRLIEVEKGEERTLYQWDFENRRLKKDDREYLYQGQDEVGSKLNGELKEFRVLGLGQGAEIGAAALMFLEDELYLPLHDLAGNVIALYDTEGEQAASYSYTAFGECFEEGRVSCPWRFSSKRYDEESGLTLFGRRFYDAAAGRFVTADPLGYEAGPNLYAYCLNAPLTHHDLYGLETDSALPFQSAYERKNFKVTERIRRVVERVKEVAHDIFNGPGRPIKTIVNKVGWGVQATAQNLLPHVPVFKDIFKGAGHFLQQGCFCNYVSVRNEPVSGWYTVGEKLNPDGYVPIEVVGIKTSTEDAIQRGKDRSDQLGGAMVSVFCTASHGVVPDLIASAMDKVGITTEAQAEFNRGMNMHAEWAGPGGELSVSSFSRGSMLTRNLGRTWHKSGSQNGQKVRLIAMGSPCTIDSNYFGSVKQAASSRDGVCFLAGMSRFNPPAHVQVIKSDAWPMLDHKFDNKVYSDFYKMNVIHYDKFKNGI